MFTITRAGNTATDVSVNYATQDGSAQAGTDYAAASGTLSFAAGETTKTVEVSVLANARNEQQELFTLVLSGNSPDTVIVSGPATVTIAADPPLPTLAIGSVTVSDTAANTAVLTVTRTGDVTAASSVNFQTVAGTAQAGSDFTGATGTVQFAAGQTTTTISIPILANSTPLTFANREGAETFTVVLSGVTDATITQDTGTVTIAADLPVGLATFSISSAQVAEGQSATITVTRAGDLAGQVTVDYATVGGSATSGADFTPSSGTLTFAAGETTKTITLSTIKDTVQEPAESFTIALQNPVGGTITQGSGTISIAADAFVPSVSVSSTSVSGGTTATLTVSLSGPTTVPVTVSYATANGSATAGSDFTAVSGTITITAGQTSATISIPIAANPVGEAAEDFSIVLSGAENATIGTGSGTISISAGLPATPALGTVEFSINSVTVSDAVAGNAVFTVTRSGETSVAASISYNTANGGTALKNTDFVDTTGTLNFAAGETTKTITVPILADSTGESAETFNVTLTGATATGTTATITTAVGVGTISADAVGNSPPTFIASVSGAVEKNNMNAGGLFVAAAFGVMFNDANPADTFAGLAIVANAANAATEGAWQYTTDAGTHWYDVGTVADNSTALMVSTGTYLRFVPIANFTGFPSSLIVRAVDSTYTGSFSTAAASETRVTLGAVTPGGTSPVSGTTNHFAVGVGESILWDGGGSGAWETATDWAGDVAPGTYNLAIINNASVTLSNNATTNVTYLALNGTTSLSLSGATTLLDVLAVASMSSGGSLTVDAATFASEGVFSAAGTITLNNSGTLDGSGAIVLTGTLNVNSGSILLPVIVNGGTIRSYNSIDAVTFSAPVYVRSGGLIDLQDISNGGGSAEVNFATTLNNAGTVSLTNPPGGFTDSVTLDMTGGTFNNLSGGVLLTAAGSGSGGGRYIVGNLNNLSGGTIDIDYGAAFNSGTLNNHGILHVGNSETFVIGAAATLVQSAGGTYVGNGTVQILSGGTFRLDANAALATGLTVGTAGGAAATVTGSGAATVSGALTLNAGTVGVTLTIAGNAYAYDTANIATLAGPVTINSGALLELKDNNNGGGNTELNISGAVSNSGTVRLTIAAGGYTDSVTLDLTGGSLTNLSGGVLQTDTGVSSGGARSIVGTVTNNAGGVVDISYNASYQGGTLTNFGNIDVAAGQTFVVETGTFVQKTGGTYTGLGAITIGAGATFRLDANGTVASGLNLGTYQSAAATISNTSGAVLTVSGDLGLKSGTISAPLFIAGNAYAYDTPDLVTLSGPVTIQSGALLELKDNSNGSGVTELNISGVATNAGTIRLTIAAGGFTDSITLDLSGGGLTNLSGGVLQTDVGASSGGTRYILGNVTNNSGGSIDINYSARYQGGTLTNAGNIDVEGGMALTIQTGTVVHQTGGTYTGAGQITLDGGTTFRFDANGTVASGLNLGGYQTSAATISNTGGAIVTVSGTLGLNSGVISAPLVIAGQANAYNTDNLVTLSGPVTINSGAVLEIKDTSNGGGNTELNISGAVSNSGTVLLTIAAGGFSDSITLDLTGGSLTNMSGGVLQVDTGASSTGTRYILGAINNNSGGVIDIDYTVGYQGGTLTNAGNIDVAAGKAFNVESGTVVHQSGGTYTGLGEITIYGGSTFRLDASGTVASGINLGTTQSAAATISRTGGAVLTVSGTLGLNSGTVSAPLVIAGNAYAYNTPDLVTLSGLVTINTGGLLELKDTSNGSGSTELNVTGTLNNSGTIHLINAAGGFTDSVTLDMTGGTLNNLSGGVIQIESGVSSGGNRFIVGEVNNSGAVNVDYNTTFTIGTADFDNLSGGVFTVASGQTATLTGSGGARFNNFAGATLTVTGTLNLNGRDLYNAGTINGLNNITFGGGSIVYGGAVNMAGVTIASGQTIGFGAGGSLTGSGTLIIDSSGTLRIDSAVSAVATLAVQVGQIAGSGAAISGTGTLTLAGTTTLNQGTISANLVNAGTLQVIENHNLTTLISGNVINAGAILISDNSNNGQQTQLNITGNLTNQSGGTITMSTPTSNGTATLDMTGHTLTNDAGATFTLHHPSDGGTVSVITFNGQLLNAGTVSHEVINQATSIFNIGSSASTNTSTGHLNLVNGTLDITGSGTFTNTGDINLASGTQLQITGTNTLIQGSGGTYTNTGGTLFIGGGATFQMNAAASIAPNVTFGTTSTAATWTGAFTATLAGTTTLYRGTISSNLTNTGTLRVVENHNTALTISGNVINAGAILISDNSNDGQQTQLNITGNLTNQSGGTITMSTPTSNGTATLDMTGHTLTNDAGATFTLHHPSDGGTVSVITFNGQLLNAGTVSHEVINQATSIFNIGSSASTNTSTGHLNLVNGTLDITGSGTFTNTGDINLASGTQLQITGTNTLIQGSGGTYTNTGGTLFIGGGATFQMNAAASIAPNVTFGTTSTAATWTGAFTATLAGTTTLYRGTISSNLTNTGTLRVVENHNTALTISGDVINSGAILISDDANNGLNTQLNITGNLTNQSGGTITLSTPTSNNTVTLDMTGHTLTNDAGATFTFNHPSDSGTVSVITFNGQLLNAGTVSHNVVNQVTTIFNIGSLASTNTSTGQFNIVAGVVNLTGSGTFTNTGTIDITTQLTAGGTLNLINGNAASSAAGTISGSGTLTNQATITAGVGTIAANVTNSSGAFFIADGLGNARTTTVSGAFTVNSGATVRVTDGAQLNLSTGFNNSGAVQLTNTIYGQNATLQISSGSIVNQSGATVSFLGGAGAGSRSLNSDLVNLSGGNVDVDGAYAFIGGTLSNSGAITVKNDSTLNTSSFVNSGTIHVTNTSSGTNAVLSVSGTLTNASTGTINFAIGSGGGLRILSGALANDTGGTVNIGIDTTFDNGSSNISNSGTFNWNDGSQGSLPNPVLTVSGSGNFMNNVGGVLQGNGTLVFTGGGALVQSGTNNLGSSPGYLRVEGDYINRDSAITKIDIGGTRAASAADGRGVGTHDALTVTGRFVAGGTLAALSFASFAAAAGDHFDIITWGSHSGMFAEVHGLDSMQGVALDPTFTDHGLTLTARAITNDGGDGNDVLTASNQPSVLDGRAGDDVLTGGNGDDLILGGTGNDTLIGGAGSNRLIGGEGTDTADYSAVTAGVHVDLGNGTADNGAGGADTLISIEKIIGTNSADTLIGNDLVNTVFGGAGDDIIIGGGGHDILSGGAGHDTFVLLSPTDAGDAITDFASGEDTITFDADAFGLAKGTPVLGENFSVIAGPFNGHSAGTNAAFVAGQASLVYSAADHALYFDANGGAQGYTTVATLQPGAMLTAADIRVEDHLGV